MTELYCPRCSDRDLYRRQVTVERERLSIAFRCATCGDGLTLTLADEWSASFKWSFTSEAEDALAELRASVGTDNG
jgi:uncharacterized protein (DUF983 family)